MNILFLNLFLISVSLIGCKPRNISPSETKAAGELVTQNQYPFVVGFAHIVGQNRDKCLPKNSQSTRSEIEANGCQLKQFCTGSYFAKPHPFILTAAHCMGLPQEAHSSVVVGFGNGWKRLRSLDQFNVVVHESFRTSTGQDLNFDIAVIKPKKKDSFDETASLALPEGNFRLTAKGFVASDYSQYEATISRVFGSTSDHKGKKKIDYEIPTDFLEKLPPVQMVGFGLTNEFVNASGEVVEEGADALLRLARLRALTPHSIGPDDDLLLLPEKPTDGVCSGDSGGPFFIQKGSNYVQVGVVSFGNNPCKGTSHAAINILKFLDWINRNIRQ